MKIKLLRGPADGMEIDDGDESPPRFIKIPQRIRSPFVFGLGYNEPNFKHALYEQDTLNPTCFIFRGYE